MEKEQIWVAIAAGISGILVAISKETRAWLEYRDKKKSQSNSQAPQQEEK